MIINPSLIQSKDSNSPSSNKNQASLSRNQSLDFPPGFENQDFSTQNQNSNLEPLLPPGFENHFPKSLPVLSFDVNETNKSINQDFSQLNSQTPADQTNPQATLNQEVKQIALPSFSNLVYYEPFNPHPKPNKSNYEKLVPSNSISTIRNIKKEKDNLERMIGEEYQLCNNRIVNFSNELEQRTRKVEQMLQELNHKIEECATVLSKKKYESQLDEIVDSRNVEKIETYLRDHSNDQFDRKQISNQDTFLNLLSILCRIYKKDKELAILWTKNLLQYTNQISDAQRLRSVFLEIKRVMCFENETNAESISSFIDSKL